MKECKNCTHCNEKNWCEDYNKFRFTTKQIQLIEEVEAELIIQSKNTDIEVAHENADKVLCKLLKKLGLNNIVEAYNKVNKWYA